MKIVINFIGMADAWSKGYKKGYYGTVTKLAGAEAGCDLVTKRMPMWLDCECTSDSSSQTRTGTHTDTDTDTNNIININNKRIRVVSCEAMREVMWYMFCVGCGLPCLPPRGRARALVDPSGRVASVEVVMPEATTDLFDWINQTSHSDRLDAATAIAEELIWVLHEVHRRGVSHGDVKPENLVLVRDDLSGRIALKMPADVRRSGRPYDS
jgi:serine/threonine protein kinase